jgi:hypothetical protein
LIPSSSLAWVLYAKNPVLASHTPRDSGWSDQSESKEILSERLKDG